MARYINADTLLEQLRDAVSHKGMGAAIAGILIQYIEAMPMIERPITDGTVTIDAENVLSGLLHCKQDAGCKNCVECPYYLSKGQCTTNLLNDAINTISNFEEQVEKSIEICHGCHTKYDEKIRHAKASILNEFVEKLKKEFGYIEIHGAKAAYCKERCIEKVDDLRNEFEV